MALDRLKTGRKERQQAKTIGLSGYLRPVFLRIPRATRPKFDEISSLRRKFQKKDVTKPLSLRLNK